MMATTEERMKILKMIDEGKISAEEGAKLLSALSESRSRDDRWHSAAAREMPAGCASRSRMWPRGGPRLPCRFRIGLLDAGLKIGAHFAPEVEGVD